MIYEFSQHIASLTMFSLQQFHVNHIEFHDRVKTWLEKFFEAKFPVNNKVLFLYLLEVDVDMLNIYSYSLVLIQFLLIIIYVHMSVRIKKLE